MVPLTNVLQFSSERTVSSMGTWQFNHGPFIQAQQFVKMPFDSSPVLTVQMFFDNLTRIASSWKKNMKGMLEQREKAVQPSLCCDNFLTWREKVFAVSTRN